MMDPATQAYTPIVTHLMEMTEQSQIENADQHKDTISLLRMLVSNGTLKHRLLFLRPPPWPSIWHSLTVHVIVHGTKFFLKSLENQSHMFHYMEIVEERSLIHRIPLLKKGLNTLRSATTISVNRLKKEQ